jgi:hypothetical protein
MPFKVALISTGGTSPFLAASVRSHTGMLVHTRNMRSNCHAGMRA